MNNLIGISGKIGSGKDEVGIVLQYLTCLKLNVLAEHQKDYNDFRLLKVSNELQSGYQIKKYADKLKDIVCLLIGCTREQLEDREFKEKELGEEWWVWESTIKGNYTIFPYTNQNMDSSYWNLVKLTPRKLLQLLGTDCGRNIIHPNIWVNALFADYKQDLYIKTNHPISENLDVKYPNWIITDVRFPNEAQAIKDRGGIVIRVERDYILRDVELPFIKDAQHPSETALDDYEFDHVIENDGSLDELIGKVKQLKLV